MVSQSTEKGQPTNHFLWGKCLHLYSQHKIIDCSELKILRFVPMLSLFRQIRNVLFSLQKICPEFILAFILSEVLYFYCVRTLIMAHKFIMIAISFKSEQCKHTNIRTFLYVFHLAAWSVSYTSVKPAPTPMQSPSTVSWVFASFFSCTFVCTHIDTHYMY